MPDSLTIAEPLASGRVAEYDAIVIGAGISGMFMLYRLRQLGMTTRVFEAGSDVGGTWYWNRYPGARFDSESWTYGYSFSKELLQEWDWKEHFSPQPDTLEYLNLVADKFDLRRDIQFNSTVTAAHWDDEADKWTVTLESGERARVAIPAYRGRHPFGLYSAGNSGRGTVSAARPTTRRAGRKRRSISPASASASSVPAPPRSRQSPRSPSSAST